MLKQRIITASILLPVILLALFFEPFWLWRAIVTIFIAVAWWEWVRLSQAANKMMYVIISTATLVGLGFVFFGVGFLLGVVVFSMCLWLGAVVCCFIIPEVMGRVVLPQTKLLFGAWVLAFSWWSLIWLREQNDGSYWVLGFLMIIWFADTGAYFVGKRFGKRKLAPAISPGKTIEGLLGGMFCVTLYAAIFPSFVIDSSRMILVLLAIVIAVVSVGGDLLESWMKRHVGMKDSSQILPGHGGVLDRIDSLIAALPFMLIAYYCINGMQVS